LLCRTKQIKENSLWILISYNHLAVFLYFLEATMNKKITIVKIADDETIYCGLDLHRKSCMIAEVSRGVVLKKTNVVYDKVENIVQFIRRRYPTEKICSVYEAGAFGFGLHRALERAGINNIVVNPGSVASNNRDRVKTDKRDALKLANQLATGNSLKGIYIPTEAEEVLRLLCRTRLQLVKKRSTIIVQIRMRLLQFGLLPTSYKQVLTKSKAISFLEKRPDIKQYTDRLINLWDICNKEISICEKQMKNLSAKEIGIYKSIPGIGEITACTLYTELGDMHQFPNQDKLISYLGLTPTEHSSGERISRGSISKQGKPHLRALLVQASWKAVRQDANLQKKFYRIANRKKKSSAAIIPISRQLAIIAYSLLKRGEKYVTNYNSGTKQAA
jgi:transposase